MSSHLSRVPSRPDSASVSRFRWGSKLPRRPMAQRACKPKSTTQSSSSHKRAMCYSNLMHLAMRDIAISPARSLYCPLPGPSFHYLFVYPVKLSLVRGEARQSWDCQQSTLLTPLKTFCTPSSASILVGHAYLQNQPCRLMSWTRGNEPPSPLHRVRILHLPSLR